MHKTQNTTPWVSGANPTKFNKTSKIETDRILKKPFPKFPEQQLSKNTSVQLDGHWLNGRSVTEMDGQWLKAYPLPNLLEFAFFFDRFCACKFSNSHHASFKLYLFSVLSHIFMLFNHLPAFLCRFYAIYCVVILHHLPAVFILHFYDFSVACCQPFP